MPPVNPGSEKKKSLQAHKEKILQNIKYYEKRIEEFRSNASSNTYFENSSDSEDELSLRIDTGPSVSQLQTEQAMLRTCVQATQELTSLQVLQSEVNVMVENPDIIGEPPVKEAGLWREVTAECRIDLVPFSIMFHVHQPDRLFPPKSYRNMKVSLVKVAHEAELARSVLMGVARPSDAIEVLRNYATAYRSRRTTLSNLVDKYANNLFMEPTSNGGFLMKCANLMKVSWHLENKWSPLAAFKHRMSFDLEYMDESYIKIIAHVNKQLSDPSIDTNDRTLLLSKIISTCLEAQGPTQELYESMESDPESIKELAKRRTRLDQDFKVPEHSGTKKKRDGTTENDVNERDRDIAKDDEIMAPPKSLPKKVKPKGKENTDQNRKSVKRSNADEGTSNVKKAKTAVQEINQMVNELDKAKSDDRNQNYNMAQKKSNVAQNGTNTDKAEASTSQKNSENEQIKNTEKAKNLKNSKNNKDSTHNTDQEKTKNHDKERNTNLQEKTGSSTEVQENTKKRSEIITESQKVPKNKVIASTKKDPKINGAQKLASKNVPTSKNYAKSKDSKAEEVANRNNNIDTTEKDPKSDEHTANKNADKLKSAVIKKPSEKNIRKDKPDSNKKSAVDNNNEKTKNQRVDKSDKNDDKRQTDVKSANTNKNTQISNKEKNKQNAKTVVTNNNSNKTVKPTEIATNKNKYLPKNNATNKTEVANAKNLDNPKNSEKDPSNKAPQKNAKPVLSTHKNINDAKVNLITKNFPKNSNIEKKIAESSTKETVEEMSKVKNVAIATKDHIADRNDAREDATINKTNSKIVNGKNLLNKMVIKNLSHKNPSTQKNLPKNASSNFKNSNTVNNFKTGNTKENGVAAKISKIPQKKLSPISESALRKNHLRISPRTISSTFKSFSDTNLKQKMALKYATNIPRFMKKAEPKIK